VTKNPTRDLLLILATAILAGPSASSAQTLPSEPISALDGRLAVGVEVVATIGEADDSAFFNYTDYEHNALRMFRVGLSASWRPADRLAFVAEVRSEDLDQMRPYAAYVSVRPWRSRAFVVQAGRIPPVFGSFGRRAYSTDNPLIGYPLGYQYLTLLRPDTIPATMDDLLEMRARGWRADYPVGVLAPGPGLPMVSAFRWDTGIQARWRGHVVEVAGAVTNGTLSDPRVADNNGGKQVSGRLAVQPAPGLIAGASAATGEWLDRDIQDILPPDTPSSQRALGADIEYSRDHWLLRGEMVWSRWDLPLAAEARVLDLDALAIWVEGRYRVSPRWFVAGRLDRLGFSRVTADTGERVTWDAPVTRVEGNVGYYIQRNLVTRVAVQYNDRDGGRVLRRTYVSGQVAYWF
jgi:hypothetical protein